MGPLAQDRRVEGALEILEAYFGIGRSRPAPFPAYMYRTVATRGLFLDAKDGGKYADVAFLFKLVSRGPIQWLSDPLIAYRIHGSNDSGEVNIVQQLRLLRFARKIASPSIDTALADEVRFVMYFRWLRARRRSNTVTAWRKRIILRHMAAMMPFRALFRAILFRIQGHLAIFSKGRTG
jgi:hypothetical protein